MIGIGYLTLPANCKSNGLLAVTLAIAVCGLASLYGTYLLTKAYNISRSANYPELVYTNARHWYFFFTTVLVCYTFFATSVYIYFGQVLLLQIFTKYAYQSHWAIEFGAKVFIFVAALLINTIRIDGLKWVGILAVGFSVFTSFVLAIELKEYKQVNHQEPLVFFNLNEELFTTLGTALFAFTNQYGVITFLKRSRESSRFVYLSVGL